MQIRVIESAAVVLGMGPTALGLVRALGRKNVKIFGIGLNRFEVSLFSRYCQRLGAIDPRYQPERLLALLLEFGREYSRHTKLVLYPSGDECVVFIAENHRELSRYYAFSKLNPDILELFLNKWRFYEACIEHGLPAPTTFRIEGADGLKAVAAKVQFPCIMKPIYYHRWAMKEGLTKAVFCRDISELLDCGRKLSENLPELIIQEVIEGEEDNIYVVAAYFDRNSTPHGIFVGQKIRQYPVGFGTTTLIRTADNSVLAERSVKFLQKVGYQGLVDVEYKYDRSTGSFYIIEINPRLGRWYGIVEAAGHDTVYYSYLDLTHQPIPKHASDSRQVKWVFVLRDVLSVANNKLWGLSDMFRSYAGTKTWCIWARDDIKPFFAYFGEIINKGLKRLYPK
jgi:predicted ATP-grasp superfamily ATP-dependent carboligase